MIVSSAAACEPPPAPTAPTSTTTTTRPSEPVRTFWIGTYTTRYRYESNGAFTSFSDETGTTYTLPPTATGEQQALWTGYQTTRSFSSGSCGGQGQDSTTFQTWTDGVGSGGPGPLGIRVSYSAAGTSTLQGPVGPGYAIDPTGGSGDIPTTSRSRTVDCSGAVTERTSTSNYRTQGGGAYVSAATDNRYVLEGSGPSRDLNNVVVSFRLRRADCSGVPDSDRDGFDDCVEFDARTDPFNAASTPPKALATAHK